jgi:response regulator RpfG family c-di-GMP phosphodiesterase
MTLAHAGYNVLTASCSAEALDLSRAYPGAIDVAVINVKWLHIIGTELATTIRRERPGIRVLLPRARSRPLAQRRSNGGNHEIRGIRTGVTNI